jgi:hypothetical protein
VNFRPLPITLSRTFSRCSGSNQSGSAASGVSTCERDALALGERVQGADGAAQEEAEVAAARAQARDARLRPGDVQELIHELEQTVRAAGRDVELLARVLAEAGP